VGVASAVPSDFAITMQGKRVMKASIIGLAALALFSTTVQAKEKEEAEKPKQCSEIIAHTIFVADKSGSRQKGSAEALSATHDNAESQGWNFADLEVYIEDGDLQGFFVTYTKTNPCQKEG
jgi:hypothetical protein